jgi:phenylalanyl-tRNA synthetase alpha chain
MEKISSAKSVAELEALDQDLFGRKQGAMTLALKELGPLSPEERKQKGLELNRWKSDLLAALADRKTALGRVSLDAIASSDKIDVTLSLPERERGHLHPIPEFIRSVEEVFGRMGFDVAEGPEIETEEYNFTLLNIPEDHPARDSQDTFWVESDTGPSCAPELRTGRQAARDSNDQLVLRTHTSPGQIRYMQIHEPPFRMICPGRVYRKDADATHSPMFHQFEGLMVGKDVSLANMKAVMADALRALLGADTEFRFRAGFFPFVEPGLEMDVRWHAAGQESRWLEVVGCGMVHPTVLRNGGVDPKKFQGFAFGFGVERLIMIKHKIPDLRSFYEGDLRFLRQF